MPSYKVKDIAKIIKARVVGETGGTIRYIVTDSRTAVAHHESLFVAISGIRNDGHRYIEEMHSKKQIRYFLVEKIPESLKDADAVTFLVVKNTLKALQLLAAFHRSKFRIPVISITGSNGKTIVKEWLYELLHDDKKVTRSPKSYNSQLGVPLSVWLLEKDTDIAIFEAGISQPNEMAALENVIKPNIGLFTNIGETHQENFKTITEKVKEKMKLFKNASHLIYCRDYTGIHKEALRLKKCKRISWSRKEEKSDLFIDDIKKEKQATSIRFTYKKNTATILIPFTDDASVENAINCLLLMLHLGYESSVIDQRMQRLSPVAMRLELKKGVNNCTIINDSYNSDIHSLAIAIDYLNQQQQHTKKTVILSDILQSGKDSSILYKHVAQLLKDKKIDRFIGIGSAISAHRKAFPKTYKFYASTADFILNHPRLSFSNEAILVKGSRRFEFEKISAYLEQKAHRTIMEVNLNAMIHNLNYFRSKMEPSTKIIVMVKAFSYGSGTYEIANMLQYQKVDYLAVAFADEGVMLRDAGITMPIMVMNPEEGTYNLLIEHSLEPEIYNFRQLKLLTEALRTARIFSFPIHIKIDSGMHRLGFMDTDLPELVKELSVNEHVKVSSLFSHLAASDESIHDGFTKEQISKFDKMSLSVMQTMKHKPMRHILNSSGIERFPEAQFDMVRLGIGIYGVGNASNQQQLKNVSSLKSTILQIKTIHPGETVGYSRKHKITNTTTIGIIPIGYADGLSRRMGNGTTAFYVNGQYAPVIGNICMDMCMLDLTGITANEGDEVEIFGDHISICTFAEKMGTIPYEVLTSVSPRVKRIYFQE